MMNFLFKRKKTVIFLFVFAINMVIGLRMKTLHFSTDEFGVLASAAFLTGKDWSPLVSTMGYYGYGQALLYVPAFFLINNPSILYASLIVINSILISCIPLIIINILEKYLKVGSPRWVALITLTVTLYPYYLIYSKWAFNETLMGLIPWICMYILLREIKNDANHIQKWLSSVLLGFILAFGYATHGRFIGIIVAVLLTIAAAHLLLKKRIVKYLFFAPALVCCLGIDYIVKKQLLANLWLASTGKQTDNTLETSLDKVGVFNHDVLIAVLKSIAGQLYYSASSTFGFILISFFICLKLVYTLIVKRETIRNDGTQQSLIVVAFFSLFSFIIAFCISVLFLIPGTSDPTSRGDYFIYGRYFDNLTGLVLFVGIYALYRLKVSWKPLIFSLFLYLCGALYVQFSLSKDILNRPSISNNPILDILPFVGKQVAIDYISNLNFLELSSIVAAVLLLIIIFIRFEQRALVCFLLIGLSLYTYAYVAEKMIVPNSERDFSQVETAFKSFGKFGDLYKQYPDVFLITDNLVKSWSSSRYQFVLPNYQVHLIDKNTEVERLPDGLEENSIIMSPYNLNLEKVNPQIYRVYIPGLTDNDPEENIWIYGERIKKTLDSASIQLLSGDDLQYRSIPLNHFNSQNTGDKSKLVSDGKEGFLMFGPYMEFQRGTYSISIATTLESSDSDELGYIDVVGHGGTQQYAKANVARSAFVDNANGKFELKFTLDEDVSDLEIRFYVNEGVRLEVNSVQWIDE